jgi:HEAT repeat protein
MFIRIAWLVSLVGGLGVAGCSSSEGERASPGGANATGQAARTAPAAQAAGPPATERVEPSAWKGHLKRLAGTQPAERIAAADALGQLGPAAAEAYEPLADHLDSPVKELRSPVARAMLRVDRDRALKYFRTVLTGDDPEARQVAVKALEYVGPAAAALLPELIHAMSNADDRWVRAAAANGMGSMGAAAATAVPALRKALNDPAECVRRYAAKALGNIGAPAAPALEDLRKLEKRARVEKNRRCIAWTRGAIAKIRHATTQPAETQPSPG